MKTQEVMKILEENQLTNVTPKMKQHILNVPIIFEHAIDNHKSVNEQLLKEIRDHKREQPVSLPSTHPGCWRGTRKYPSESMLLNLFGKASMDAAARQGLDTRERKYSVRVSYWVNVNGSGGFNELHNHVLGDYSGVYYVKGTGTGDISFHSTEQLNKMIAPGMPFADSISISPQDGMLLVFPSYILHSVHPNLSDKERISIAFDANIIYQGRNNDLRFEEKHPQGQKENGTEKKKKTVKEVEK